MLFPEIGLLYVEHPHLFAGGVHLDPLFPIDAPEVLFVHPFQPELAYGVALGVSSCIRATFSSSVLTSDT